MASNGPQCKDRLNIFREMAYSSKCEQLYLRETTKGNVYPPPPPPPPQNGPQPTAGVKPTME